ncbi:MAG: hypothetical protein FD189_2180 [Elusimicrobia bacterium]|nr:MAG: hypothetical protein FD154_1590 [Elusimicrobiota bacterium]KAF0153932.1 MAG: hypothetical protein FD189_2180 [Elusimicrobiota bacterium]
MFKPLGPGDYARLKPYFAGQGYQLCPYSPASMIIWAGCVHDAFYFEDGDRAWFAEHEQGEGGRRRLLLPVCRPFRMPSPAELADGAARLGYREFRYVPQDWLDAVGRAEAEKFFTVKEEDGYHDYIYERTALAALDGRRYAKKRNLVSQFEKACGASAAVGAMKGACLKNCLDLFDHWEKSRGEAMDIKKCERKAIANALAHFRELEMSGVAVELSGRLAGFAFGSRLSDGTWALNFEKADISFKGLYQFLDREAARAVPAAYSFIDKENDLGLAGLKKAKESYFPVKIVKSYTLELKN